MERMRGSESGEAMFGCEEEREMESGEEENDYLWFLKQNKICL